MTAWRWIAILRARWGAATIAFASVALLALAITLVMPKTYTARASVVLDITSLSPAAGGASQAVAPPNPLSAEIAILNSRRVAELVVNKMGSPLLDELKTRWADAGKSSMRFEDWAVETLQQSLAVQPSTSSNVIHVSFTATNPQDAAETADAFVNAYLDVARGLKVDPARQDGQLLNDGARQLQAQLESAEKKLSDFRLNNEAALVSDERFEAETTRLNELTLQLASLQSEADASSRTADAKGQANQAREVAANPLIANLAGQLSREEADFLQVSSRLGSQHPEVLARRATIAELHARIAAETTRLTSSLGANTAVSRSRIANVRTALEEQRSKVQKLKVVREQAAVMHRDVDAAQRANKVLQTLVKASDAESRSRAQDSSARLEKAAVPDKPSSPDLLINGLAGLALACLAAVAAPLLREVRDRRLRTAEEIEPMLGHAVIGVLPVFNKQKRPEVALPMPALQAPPTLKALK